MGWEFDILNGIQSVFQSDLMDQIMPAVTALGNGDQSFGLLKTLPIYDPDIILKLPFSNCATYCLGAVLIMRSTS